VAKSTPLVLMTRPQAQSERFLAQLGQDVDAVISPILKIEPTGAELSPQHYKGVVLTSANALQGTFANFSGLACFAVGDATAEEAERCGLMVKSADGTADDLVEMIIAEKPEGRLLFLRGEHSRGELAARLRSAGIDVEEVITYRQRPQPLSSQAVQALQRADIAILPVFSPRSARLLAEALAKVPSGAQLKVIAMSDAVAGSWGESVPAEVFVASEPKATAMVRAVERVLKGLA